MEAIIRTTTATIMPIIAPVEILCEGVVVLVIFDVVALDFAGRDIICDGAFGCQLFWETEKFECS